MDMISMTGLRKSLLFCKYALQIREVSLNRSVPLTRIICSRSASNTKLHPDESHDTVTLPNKANEFESDMFGTLTRSLESSFRYKSRVDARKQKIVIFKDKAADKEADTFGNLSKINPVWYSDVSEESKKDNDLDDDSVIVRNIDKRYRCPRKYLQDMKRLVKEKKVKDALELFVDMRRNFVTPIHAHYTFMIGACGKVGFTEMAFKLLRQMTDRNYWPTAAVLTGLFNACAETPFPEYGLKKAHLLKEKILTKNWQPNQITYHAMIKAFGKCGDLSTAFQIVDEMAKADVKIDVETYSFLLMSCIGNKETGFTYAVEVWRKMKAKKCLPNIFTCNLLLRAARDCDIGPEEISSLLLQHWSSYSKRPYGFVTKESLSKEPIILKLKCGQESNSSECQDIKDNVQNYTTHDNNINGDPPVEEVPKYELKDIADTNIAVRNSSSVPSLLSARPKSGLEILELVNIKTPNDRLSLIGGMEGFLKFMRDAKIKPSIKTFTLLLECLPSNIEEEEKLLSALDSHRVKPDMDFFNMLIKRRNLRRETEAARNVLVMANKYELTPDIVTFGVLALGCRTLQQAKIFISEMEKFGSYPNIEIMGAMLKNACYIFDYLYMRFVLKLMEELDIKPNEKVLLQLEQTLKVARKNIIAKEQDKEAVKVSQQRDLSADFREFYIFYEDWLKRMKLDAQAHPWSQYNTDIIGRAKRENITQY